MMRIFSDKRGVVGMMFGLVFPIVIAAMGLGYDLAQGYMARARLAQALDAAGLAVAGSTGNQAQLQARFQAFMNANYPEAKLGDVSGLTFTRNGNSIDVTGSVRVDTSFMKWFGRDYLDVTASSQIQREMNTLEVAVVLDNTGSMAGSKLQSLKEAATSLVNILEQAADYSVEPDAVKIALVPYTMTVNVGTGNANAVWLDRAGQSTVARQIFTGTAAVNRINLFTSMSRSWGGCVEMRAAPYDVTESPPTTGNLSTLYVPFFAPDEPDSSTSTYGGPYYNNYRPDGTTSTNWQTRQGNPGKYTAAPNRSGVNSIGYQYGPNAGCEIQPLMRLTTNFSALRTRINAMNAVGDTIILTGLMWGWHTLSPYAPFSDGAAYNTEDHEKVLVLMTDGQNANVVVNNNNQSAYSGIGYLWQNRIGITSGTATQRRDRLDTKLATACENAKAAGITIYTVRLETPGDATVMRECASEDDFFYDVDDSDDLNDAFIAIANSIQNLHLSR